MTFIKSYFHISIVNTNKNKSIFCVQIIKIVKKYPGSRVTILETPTYSIKKWNKQKGHKDPSLFEEQDEKLAEQIHNLNSSLSERN